MPTVMEQALKQAGIKTPTLFERAWNWVKDHPGHTSSEVGIGLRLDKKGLASTVLSQLAARGMVHGKLEHRRGIRGAKNSSLLCWSVEPSMESYELLPKVNKKAPTAKMFSTVMCKGTNIGANIGAAPSPLPAPNLSKPAVNIEMLTVKEAYDLYQQLLRYFGAK